MKKRILSLLIALCLVVGLCPSAFAAALDNGLEYEIVDDHVEITGYTGTATELVIPDEIEGLPVTVIGNYAFDGLDRSNNLTSVTIPDTVTTIGNGAFTHCDALTSITIPEGVTNIGSSAFYDCDNLATVTIPSTVTTIGRYAFYGCISLKSIVIPDGVTILDECVFYACNNMTSIAIPGSVTTIAFAAFNFCRNLTDIYYSGSEEQWNAIMIDGYNDALQNAAIHYHSGMPGDTEATSGTCGDNLTWVLEDGVLTVSGTGPMFEATDGWEWQPYAEQITRVVLEEGVTTVGSGAFLIDYNNLESVSFPSTLTAIGNNAFAHAYALTDVALPDGLIDIGMYAFLRTAITEIGIPDSVTTLGVGVFSECPDLTYVKLPASLKEIVTMSAPFTTGNYLFAGCPALTTVEMPVYDEGFSLGAYAFADCTALTDIDFYTGTIIDESMFEGCTGLTDITISKNVTEIGTSAFEGCTGLNSVTFEGDAPAFSSKKVFYDDTLTAYYPANNATWTEDVMQDYGGEITWLPYTANPFTDVPEGSFYHDPVMWAIENNITNGLTASTFGPNATCNRAQVVTFLWRAAGCPEPTSSVNPFVDVAAGSFYEKPVLWAVEKNITNGSDATHFNPNGVCNRAQVVTFLYRAFESPAVSTSGLPFTDVPAGSWYEAPIAWAVENDITNGLSATMFGPDTSCNRAQVVTFLYRAYTD